MHNKVAYLIFVVLAAVGIFTWDATSPARTMAHLRQTAIRGDAAELSRWIDIRAIRRSAEMQARAEVKVITARNKAEGDFKAEIEGAASMCAIPKTLDSLITPAAIGGLILTGRPDRPVSSASQNTAEANWSIERSGFGTFQAVYHSEVPFIVIFQRSGLAWKITDVLMPVGRFAPWATVDPPPGGFPKNMKLPIC